MELSVEGSVLAEEPEVKPVLSLENQARLEQHFLDVTDSKSIYDESQDQLFRPRCPELERAALELDGALETCSLKARAALCDHVVDFFKDEAGCF